MLVEVHGEGAIRAAEPNGPQLVLRGDVLEPFGKIGRVGERGIVLEGHIVWLWVSLPVGGDGGDCGEFQEFTDFLQLLGES